MPQAAVAGVGLAVGAFGTMKGISESKKAAKANAAASELDRQRMALQTARERRDAIKATRTSMAQIQQSAENQGVASSSSAIGGQVSVASQGAANLSFLDKYGSLSDQASVQLGKANAASAKANTYGAIGNLGFSILGQSSNIASVWGK